MPEEFLQKISDELRSSGEVDEAEAAAIAGIGSENDRVPLAEKYTAEPIDAAPVGPAESQFQADLRAKIRDLKFPEKIKLALYGNMAARAILIFDVNKIIQQCVLRNPKLSQGEIEEFCKSPNIPQAVLRSASERQEWMKSYSLKEIIVTNPKTPGDVALKWIKHLNAPEIKQIARAKGLPQIVVSAARRRLNDLESKS